MNNLKIYMDKDIDLDLIKSKTIAIIGFGSLYPVNYRWCFFLRRRLLVELLY